jgi:LCP family protein required for cell wall assembly
VADTVQAVRRHRARPTGFARRYVLALGVVVAVVLVTIVGVDVFVAQKLASVPKVHLQLASAPSGGANYLLVGSDTRAFVSNPADRAAFGSQSANDGQRSDTIMILHTEPNAGRSLLVSVPRDLWVNVPGQGMAKINAAFDRGPQTLVNTIQADLGVSINHYVEVNFDTFRHIVDAIGSVPVYFPAPARDSFSDLNIPFPGCYHLNGPQALSFVRSRDMQVFDASTGKWRVLDAVPDIGRIGRQQAFVRELSGLAMDTALNNPLKANVLVDNVTGDLKLDDGFARSDLFSIVDAFRSVNPSNPSQVQSTTLPWQTGPSQQGQEVLYLRQPAAGQVIAALNDFNGGAAVASSPTTTAGPSTAGLPAASSVRVRVLNASGVAGIAGRTLATLARAGFVSAGSGNAPRRATTEIHYRNGSDAAARLVAERVPGAHLVVDSSVTGADVDLVLGHGFSGLSTPTAATTAPASSASAPAAAPQPGSLAPVPGPC